MASTYTPIATTTLGSTAANYTFSSISSAYTDLVLIASFGDTTGDPRLSVRFNSDSATNYSSTSLEGQGTSAVSQRQSNADRMGLAGFQGGAYSSPYTNIINIMNYSNTTTYKTAISRNNANSAGAYVGLWRSTAAISSITLIADDTTFTVGSTFTLYGIAAA